MVSLLHRTYVLCSASCLVETVEQCLDWGSGDLHIFNHPLSSCLSIHNDTILDVVFNFGIMPLILVKKLESLRSIQIVWRVILRRSCQILFFIISSLGFSSPRKGWFIVAYPHSIQFTHDEGGPLPCLPDLNVVLELVCDEFTCVTKGKMHCLKIEASAMWAFLLMVVTTLCHMDHVKNN